jgi:hypothetical protein
VGSLFPSYFCKKQGEIGASQKDHFDVYIEAREEKRVKPDHSRRYWSLRRKVDQNVGGGGEVKSDFMVLNPNLFPPSLNQNAVHIGMTCQNPSPTQTISFRNISFPGRAPFSILYS